ncbi:hypothetical protein GMRT_12454 [Giardia muris]|uniref:Uncharacterized protein n=1 Tax=Giardia muris TaxID=5742 RepID=A0A4Z1SNV5_GIAMU|nr:hypothetical protein GMRT_12454 [Giardia muris]|eukprot:TNJ27476.1 hypothetical protein GMRT_12454 [Giardia muris]
MPLKRGGKRSTAIQEVSPMDEDLLNVARRLEAASRGGKNSTQVVADIHTLATAALLAQDETEAEGEEECSKVIVTLVEAGAFPRLLDMTRQAAHDLIGKLRDQHLEELCAHLKDLLVLVKCCSDSLSAFDTFVPDDFLQSLHEVSKVIDAITVQQDTSEDDGLMAFAAIILTLHGFCLYNIVRHTERLAMDMAERTYALLADLDTIGWILRALKHYSPLLSEDARVVLAEFFAALTDGEPFLDYAAQYFAGETALLFVSFYDTTVVPLLERGELKARLGALDDFLSFLARERPDALGLRDE